MEQSTQPNGMVMIFMTNFLSLPLQMCLTGRVDAGAEMGTFQNMSPLSAEVIQPVVHGNISQLAMG